MPSPSKQELPGDELYVDTACSQHHHYRDIIQCGDAWHRLASTPTSCANLPQQPETWQGLQHLAQAILDPLVAHFGPLQLTYGFASPALTRHIGARIAPELDQHAGSELNRAGRLVCARRGRACNLRAAAVPWNSRPTWVAKSRSPVGSSPTRSNRQGPATCCA